MISGAGTGTMTIGAKGTLDVEKGTSGPGATLDGVRVADDNTSTVTPGITVGTGASAATLLLDDGTTISGLGTGTMTIGAEGTWMSRRATSGPGATLDGVRVADDNTSTVTPGITVGTGASAATLLLDDGTVIRGGGTGTMTIGANGTLDVEKGTSGPGATLDGVLVADDNTSTVTPGITVGTGASAATLLLDDGATISGLGTGTMTIGAKGTLDVEKGTSGPGATLDGVKVTDKNTSTGTAAGITVGTGASAATLLVDDGTVISGGGTGTMTIGAEGTLDVEHNTGSAPDATLDGVAVTSGGIIDVGATSTATLTLTDDLVTNTGGTLTVDANGTLNLTDTGSKTETIKNGQLNNNGTMDIGLGGGVNGEVLIENEDGKATIGSGTNSFTNTGMVEVKPNSTLTLLNDLVTNISGTIKIDAAPGGTPIGTLDVSGTTITGGPLAVFGLGQALVVGHTVVFPSISVFDLNSADATELTLTATVSGGGTLSLGSQIGQTTIEVGPGTYSQITGELNGLTFTPSAGRWHVHGDLQRGGRDRIRIQNRNNHSKQRRYDHKGGQH